MSDEHGVKALCALFAVSRSGFYRWRRGRPCARAVRDEFLRPQIAAIHARHRGVYGSPRILRELRAHGQRVGRKRVARLMREAGLWGRQRRRYRVRTTDSRHEQPVAANRLLGRTPPIRANQVWLADVTYVPTAEGWLYVAGVLDRASRRLVGWAMSASLETALPMAALQMALQRCRPPRGLIHHSDRGCQYASADYSRLLRQHGLVASMSRPGNCYDNAVMEAFWSTLKHEVVYRHRFASRAHARTVLFDYIEAFYNRTRRHSSIGYLSPLDYESSLS
jgi:putative transposase